MIHWLEAPRRCSRKVFWRSVWSCQILSYYNILVNIEAILLPKEETKTTWLYCKSIPHRFCSDQWLYFALGCKGGLSHPLEIPHELLWKLVAMRGEIKESSSPVGEAINCGHEFDSRNNRNFYLLHVIFFSEASCSICKPRPSPGSF